MQSTPPAPRDGTPPIIDTGLGFAIPRPSPAPRTAPKAGRPRKVFASSWRGRPLPVNWDTLKAFVFKRDGHRCVAVTAEGRCRATDVQCDHLLPASRGGSDEVSNLVSLCTDHHAVKSKAEAKAGRNKHQRPQQKHPGLLW